MIKTKVQSITETSNGNGIPHMKLENTKSNKSVHIIFISILLDLLAFTIIANASRTISAR